MGGLSAFLLLGCLAGGQEALKTRAFPQEGLEVGCPEGWEPARSQLPGVVLRAVGPREGGDLPPVLQVFHARKTDPTTFSRYRRDLRATAEKCSGFKFIHEEDVVLGGRKAYCLTAVIEIARNGKNAVPVRMVRCGGLLAPRRHVLVEVISSPEDGNRFDALAKRVFGSIRTIERPLEPREQKGLRAFSELLKKLGTDPAAFESESALGICFRGRPVGTYRVRTKSVEADGETGFEVETELIVDLGEEGKSRTTVTGFMDATLSTQRISMIKRIVDQAGEILKYRAHAALREGKVEVERTILGEKSSEELAVPKGTVFRSLLVPFLLRLVEHGRIDMHVRVLNAYDRSPVPVRIEVSKMERILIDKERRNGVVIFVTHPHRRHRTYIIGTNRELLQVKAVPFRMERRKGE